MISSCRHTDEHPPLLRSTPFKGGRSGEASCSRGCVSKANVSYQYRYGGKLSSVTSNFPGESNVSYEYRGDGKRHSRTAGGVTTRYGWDMGWNVIHEESAGGTLQKSYVMHSPEAEVARILGDIAGTNPATGTTRYYAHDHLGSTRNLYSTARQMIGTYWYIQPIS